MSIRSFIGLLLLTCAAGCGQTTYDSRMNDTINHMKAPAAAVEENGGDQAPDNTDEANNADEG